VITSAPSHPVAKSLSGVTISLSDGSTVLFDSVERGFRLPQGTADLIKGDSGQLIYASAKSSNKFPVYNTVSTARGRQFRLTLQDGTKVWLNAGSSITFPTAFTGRERNVQISGEVYLEVAKNKEMPFHVRANDITITVLGTHFNVRAYSDEKEIKTTLLEGSVKVNRKSSNVILRPGQEARALNVSDQKISVRPADVESVTAWTNGYFRFDNADIYQVMGEIARWYDVEVKFEGEVRSHEFVGQLARSSKLSEVLKILEMEKVHIARRGNKLIVRP
jgi:ferric-dicitrate binding protein FerR (iron transport regulator)